MRDQDAGHVLGVRDGPEPAAEIVGMAFGVTHAPDERGPIAVFRLKVDGRWLPGAYVCQARRFVRFEGLPEASITPSWITAGTRLDRR